MHRIIVVVCLAVFLLLTKPLLAENDFEIKGLKIPLIQGTFSIEQESKPVEYLTVRTYAIEKPLDEVATFYQAFLEANGFEVMGGQEGGEYNVSARKEELFFTLRIYPGQQRTIIQFVW